MKKILLVLALLLMGGCSYPDPTPYQIFGIQRFYEIKRNPEPHVGKLYAFGGNVINTYKKDNQITFEMFIQEYDRGSDDYITSNSSMLVVYPSGKTTVADGHHVKVLGYIREPAVGENVFGAKVSSLVMDAIALYDSFTRYPFWLRRYEDIFNKWKTGEPLAAGGT
jgi:starvation-inducible outer membrane lipoprotein